MPKINLLDCTFRDGGYYNQWAFPQDLVVRYLKAAETAGIEVLEMGFRSMPQNGFLGAYAYTSDDLLASLPLPKRALIGVMINAKELLAHPQGPEAAADFLFAPAATSPVKLVRIAAHFGELAGCQAIARRLKDKGYLVGLNLMQADGKSAEELAACASRVDGWKSVDVLYFADSLGNMDAAMVAETIRALRRGWKGPIGAHTHNNMGQALANSMAAIEAGATWIDGTMTGMGRGAGNANTEYLILELTRRGLGDYHGEPLFAAAMEDFERLRRQYGWGPNVLYYLSAAHGIHPTYVQEMMGKGQYDAAHLLKAMEFLKSPSSRGFSKERMGALLSAPSNGTGTWSAKGWAKGRSLLVIAPGSGTRLHLDALRRFIAKKTPAVVCLNVNTDFPPDLVTAYAALHKSCITLDAAKYRQAARPLIAPNGAIPDGIKAELAGIQLLDYGMSLKPGTFEIHETGCVVPAPVVAAYVLGLAEASGAKDVLLSGFDGYGADDWRQREMNEVLQCYRARPQALKLLAVTPTTYDVPQGSIYSPGL